MSYMENNEMFDLGSAPVSEDFDPFAFEDELNESIEETNKEEPVQEKDDPSSENPEMKHTKEDFMEEPPLDTAPAAGSTSAADTPKVPVTSDTVDEKTGTSITSGSKTKGSKTEKTGQGPEEKPPVFAYAGALENIGDVSMTFEELRIEKAVDFPELEDGKRVSWTVEYGKVTKTVSDPRGTSIGRMKSEIETSKEFLTGLKRAKDKNPVCKVKPRVTAQTKGTASAYKGVFTTMEEAEEADKVISVVPARDGKVYEIRNTEMGKFITPVVGCGMLSDVQAGFTPALPYIPLELLIQVVAFFRHFIRQGFEKEALLNIYWDKESQEFLADAPEQVVSKVSVNSTISERFSDNRYIHYMDIHSHNTMKAFFSEVDDHDEKATRLYTVVGKLDQAMPEIRTRISNGGKFLDIDPSDVFELPDESFPDVWVKNVDTDIEDRMKSGKERLHMEKKEIRRKARMEKKERKARQKMEKRKRKMERKTRKVVGAI